MAFTDVRQRQNHVAPDSQFSRIMLASAGLRPGFVTIFLLLQYVHELPVDFVELAKVVSYELINTTSRELVRHGEHFGG
jgi:hypothetical protein